MAMTMVGTQTPQKLFGDIPASNAQIPGMVTPNITAAMPSMVDWADIINAQNAQKALSHAAWARSAALNNVGRTQPKQETYLPGTASQTSGMGYEQNTSGMGSPAVMWAPRNLQGPKLGTWTQQQQNRAIAENREVPTIVQAHTGDPYSPNEIGSMPTSSRGLYGPGLTSALGGANAAVLARMWGGDGRTRQAQPQDVFPEQSLRERTSPGPQYKYDMWGGR